MIADLDLGARVCSDGSVAFKVWAPRVRTIEVSIVDGPTVALTTRDGEIYEGRVDGTTAGADYVYVLDGDRRRPDPVSRSQPKGVHGPSRVVDPGAFAWSDHDWRGIALEDYLLYELHIGTFTERGTFDAAIEKIPYLKELGVTAVEIMPVAEFPGARNWGYDGVHLFAPQSTYGGPEGLRRLVDALHRAGLAAVLDVVYNHFGAEGNYTSEYGPFFSTRYSTSWGDAMNVDDACSDGVRRHLITNAVHWIREYHFDALRLDAIHGIFDFSARHVLEELHAELQHEAQRLGRRAFIIAESDLNDVRVISPVERGGLGLDTQWSDDFHHSVRAALTGDRRGYFEDFGRVKDIEKALVSGYVYDGRHSRHRKRRHGNAIGDRPGTSLVVYVQTHDQIANASSGQRIASLLPPDAERLAAALLFVAPNLLMLFMGEEYGETAPFHYFVDHGDKDLVRAVVEGRRQEHASFDAGAHAFADPSTEETFAASKLDWTKPSRSPHAERLALQRDLIMLRKSTRALHNARRDLTRAWSDDDKRWLAVERCDPSGQTVLCVLNLAKEAQSIPVAPAHGSYGLVLSTDAKRYGGTAERGSVTLTFPGTFNVVCPPLTAQIFLAEPTR